MLKPAEGNQYIIMPLADHGRDAEIKNVQAKAGYEWKDKILRQLEHYKKKSPYYAQVLELLLACFALDETNITILNGHYLKLVCDYIGISFRVEISSGMNFNYSNVRDAGEWALRISEQIGATEYINPYGGVELFDPIKFSNSNIALRFLRPQLKEYSQRRATFEPGLSILDILMFNSPEAVMEMLKDYTLS